MSEPNLDSVPATPVTGNPPDLTEDAAEATLTEGKQRTEELIQDIAKVLAQQEGLPEGAG